MTEILTAHRTDSGSLVVDGFGEFPGLIEALAALPNAYIRVEDDPLPRNDLQGSTQNPETRK